MRELKIFNGNQVEVFEMDGIIYFNPYDVGACLDISESAIRDHMSKMNKKQAVLIKNSDVGLTDIRKLNNAGEKFLTESGVYKLIFKSRKPIAEKFQNWVTDEVLPAVRKTGSYKPIKNKLNDKLKIQEMNAKTRMANMYLKLSSVDTLSKEYKNILVSKATQVLSGEELLPLPKSQQNTYSATEIGNMLGVSANKVGKLAKANNLKTEEYGEWYRSKSEHCNKEIDTFKYYDSAVQKFKEILNSNLVVM